MIHPELCSACGGPLQLGVGLLSNTFQKDTPISGTRVQVDACAF